MANISKITLPDNVTYDIKDENALRVDGTAVSSYRMMYTHRITGAAGWYHFLDISTAEGQTRVIQLLIDNGQSSVSGILRIYMYRTGSGSLATSSIVNWITTTIPIDYVRWTYSNGVTSFYIYKSSTTDRAMTFTVLSAINRAGTNLDPSILVWDNTAVSEPTTATPATANILNNAATATSATQDINGDQIDTTYLKIANASNPNLLRNWYFVGGGTGRGVLPVNQRGFTTSSNVNHVWSIDGWLINGGRGTQTLNANGFYLSNTTTSGNTTIQQWVGTGAEYEGKVMTLSALSDIGLVTSTFTVPAKTSSDVAVVRPYFSDRCSVAFYALSTLQPGYVIQFIVSANSSITIKAVKLELGTEQTLAHQENDTWILNEIPDYEAELIKCQTYTIENSDTYTNKSLATEQQLAHVETGTTASRAYDVGEYFCWNGLLYRVISAISNGGSFTPGTNCETDVVGDFMYSHEYPSENWFVLGPGKKLTIHIGGGNNQCQAAALVCFNSNVSSLNGGVAYLRSYDSRAGFHPLTFFIGSAPSDISINNAAGVIEIMNNTTGTGSSYVLISMLGCRQKNITFSLTSNA